MASKQRALIAIEQAEKLARAFARVSAIRAGDELTEIEWHQLKLDCEILEKLQIETGIELIPSKRMHRMINAWEPVKAA